MSRVVLTILGTNDYLPCCYEMAGLEDRPVRFIQESVVRKYCTGWCAPDKIVVFVTDKSGGDGEPGSYEKNWLDNGQTAPPGKQANGTQGLESVLADITREVPYQGLAGCIQHKVIPWGRNREELWGIFKSVVGEIRENDEIIFDVTHSFRSLPMLAFAALLFVRAVRNVTIKAVTYGAFEVLGPIHKITSSIPNPVDRKAPVFDLFELLAIIDWSESAMLFKKYGEAGPLIDLLYQEINPMLSVSQGKDDSAHTRRGLAKQIESFINAVRTVRGRELVDIGSFDDALSKIKQTGAAGGAVWAFDQLFDMIQNTAADFKSGNLMNGLHAVRFCLDHGLTQQALTLLDETMISMMCRLNGLDWQNSTHREIVSSAPVIKDKPQQEWHGSAEKNRELTQGVITFMAADEEYLKISRLLDIRNDINHAGITEPTSAEKLRSKCKEIYELAILWAQKNYQQ